MMPYNDNSGGPWGKKGNDRGDNKGSDDRNPWGGGNRPNNGNGQGPNNGQVPDIEDMLRKGQEQFKVLMGGRGGGTGGGNTGSGGDGPSGKLIFGVAAVLGAAAWLYASAYTVQPSQRSVELTLGQYSSTGGPGLNFAPWPVVTYEIVEVTNERIVNVGTGTRPGRSDDGLMLTGDENIVDIDFEVVWNINDPAAYLFNLRDPEGTISSVSESAMREVISRSELAPILNRDRGIISAEVSELIQQTLNNYDSGISVVRLNFDRADPPNDVIDAFRDVQAAEQERVTAQNRADAYSNRALAEARGEAAQLLQQAEGYRAPVVNEAEGEAARFLSILTEYQGAEEVTRKRLYIEMMERVLGDVDKIIIDQPEGGQGVLPYLPLNELRRGGTN